MPQTTKQQSKLKKLSNFFNPKTLKGGIALFALIFAVTGGGYLLYRSFAATGGRGSDTTCWVKKSDKTLWCWGNNYFGQLGLGDTTSRKVPTQVKINNVSQVSAGQEHTCASKTDGTLWCWGANHDGQLGLGDTTSRNVPTQLYINNVSKVSTGFAHIAHTCASKTDGTLWCWGNNTDGQLGINSSINKTVPTQLYFTWK